MEQLRQCSRTLPALWQEAQLTPAQQKELVRSLIRQVIITRPLPDTIEAKVVWVSGAITPLTVHPPILRQADMGNYEAFVERVLTLGAEGYQDRAIAQRLTAEGFRSARGERVTADAGGTIRRARGQISLTEQFKTQAKIDGQWTVFGLAQAVGVHRNWLYARIRKGTLPATRHAVIGHYLIPDDPELLAVVEDDLALADVTSFTLRRAGFEVVNAYNGVTAIEQWEKEQPGLMLLDLNLPKQDGMAVCRHIRQHGDTPSIILSVRNTDESIVEALELGADDYVVKPYGITQLVVRVRAVLRRAGTMATLGLLETNGLALDRSRNEVQRAGGEPIRLAPLEVRLLEALMLNAGQVLPTDTLIDKVWGPEGGDRAMLKQLVYRLRTKLEPDIARSTIIENVPGVGYTLLNERS